MGFVFRLGFFYHFHIVAKFCTTFISFLNEVFIKTPDLYGWSTFLPKTCCLSIRSAIAELPWETYIFNH